MSKLLAVFLLSFTLLGISMAQEDVPKGKQPVAAASSVPGLEIPPDQTVNYDEGFVTLQAKCKGDVKWLVVASSKVKFVTVPAAKQIIISVPPQGGTISVFAVGLVDGTLTEFARTNVTVGGNNPGPPPSPNPNPTPPPNPQPAAKLHVTFLIDQDAVTPELAQLLNSKTLRGGINQKGHWFRLYNLNAPIVAQKKLDQVAARVPSKFVMIIQDDTGKPLVAQAIPSTEKQIFDIITNLTGR